MTPKNWLLVSILIVLSGVYVCFFTDWFKPKTIHISHISRAGRPRHGRNLADPPTTIPVTFGVEPQCRLTEITVVPLAAWQANRSTLPVWHLVASSNAVPIKTFTYGQRLRGLEPAVPGTRATPLQPGITYRLFITAGNAKGEHDFTAKPTTQN